MPKGWRVDRRPVEKEEQHQGVRIIGDDRQSIRLYKSYQSKNKVTLCGECPDYGLTWQQKRNACLPYGSNSINVNPERNPCHIAADIQRRLLPDYVAMLEKAEKTAHDYKQKLIQADHVAHVFRCLMPDLKDYDDNVNCSNRRYHVYKGDEGNFRSADI